MLKTFDKKYQGMRFIVLPVVLSLMSGCSQANRSEDAEANAVESVPAASQVPEKDDGPQLDVPLEEPPLPAESKSADSTSDDGSGDTPATDKAEAPAQP